MRNVEYLLLAVMSELSIVLCDRVLGLWLQVHGRRVSTESCRVGAVADDRAVDGSEGQPGPELGPGGRCGVHSWIEGASADGWRVS